MMLTHTHRRIEFILHAYARGAKLQILFNGVKTNPFNFFRRRHIISVNELCFLFNFSWIVYQTLPSLLPWILVSTALCFQPDQSNYERFLPFAETGINTYHNTVCNLRLIEHIHCRAYFQYNAQTQANCSHSLEMSSMWWNLLLVFSYFPLLFK